MAPGDAPCPTPPQTRDEMTPDGRTGGVGLDVCAVVWFVLGFLLLPGVAAAAAARLGLPENTFLTALTAQAAGLLMLPLLLRATAPSWRAVGEHFHLAPWRGWWFGKGFLLALGLAVTVAGVTIFWERVLRCLNLLPDAMPPNQEIFFHGGSSGRLLLTTAALLVAPLWEELAFRNGLFGLLRRLVPYGQSAALTAAVFAALHGSLLQFPGLMLLALCWQEIREQTHSCWSTVVLHFYNNLFALLMMWGLFLLTGGHGAA